MFNSRRHGGKSWKSETTGWKSETTSGEKIDFNKATKRVGRLTRFDSLIQLGLDSILRFNLDSTRWIRAWIPVRHDSGTPDVSRKNVSKIGMSCFVGCYKWLRYKWLRASNVATNGLGLQMMASGFKSLTQMPWCGQFTQMPWCGQQLLRVLDGTVHFFIVWLHAQVGRASDPRWPLALRA